MKPSALNHRYRAELSRNECDSPVLRIFPMNPKAASERQTAACIYELAAALELATEELGERWCISPNTDGAAITVEMSRRSSPLVADVMIEGVLTELNVPCAEVR